MPDIPLPALPLGTSDFEALRERGQVYVDKTALIFDLARCADRFLLTRPRRFGKSLLVSTLASLFRHGLKHFSGLAIEKLWRDKTYDVVQIDFSEAKRIARLEEWESCLNGLLASSFAPLGFRRASSEKGGVIEQLAVWLKARPKNSMVLLVDEYDAPLTACLTDRRQLEAVRARLSDFYAMVQACDACWRFVFVTGIASASQTDVFTSFDNLIDISRKRCFAALLGFTEEDIDRSFGRHVQQAAQELRLSDKEVRRELRSRYGGCCFDARASVVVHSPWSVLNFLRWPEDGFENYWVKSGGRISVLLKYLRTPSLRLPLAYGEEQMLSVTGTNGGAESGRDDIELLTQAGYFTLKRRQGRTFFVGYPNREVVESMAELYSDLLLHGRTLESVGAGQLPIAVEAGNANEFFEAANRAFAAIDGAACPIQSEEDCLTFLQVFIAGAGCGVGAEKRRSHEGRDLALNGCDWHWVLELKLQRAGDDAKALLADAVRQLKAKSDGASAGKPLVRAAAVFSEEKRAFVAWAQVD